MEQESPNISVQLKIPEPNEQLASQTSSMQSIDINSTIKPSEPKKMPRNCREIFEDEKVTRLWLDSTLGVLIPPLQMLIKHKSFNTEVLITFCLWLVFLLPGIFYYFWKDGVDVCENIVMILCPPWGYYLGNKRIDFHFFMTLGLWILTFGVGG